MTSTAYPTLTNLPEGYVFVPSIRGVIYNDAYRYHGYVNDDATISFLGEQYPDIESFTTAVAQKIIKSEEYIETLKMGRGALQALNLEKQESLERAKIDTLKVKKDRDTIIYLTIFLIAATALAVSSTTALVYYRNI